MAPQNQPAVPSLPQGFANNITNLVGVLGNLSRAGANASVMTKGLDAQIVKWNSSVKKAQKPVVDLAKALPLLTKGGQAADIAIGKLADKFAGSMHVMSEAQSKAFAEMMKAMEAAEGGTAAKDMTNDQLILSEKKRKMSVETYQDEIKMEVLRGKAVQTSGQGIERVGNLISGSMQSMWGKAKLAKSELVGGVGEFLGLAPETMALATGPLVLLTGAFFALNSVSKAAAENVNNASKAGFTLGDTIASAAEVGADYETAIFEVGIGSMMSKKELLELSQVFNQEMGQSIDNTMEGSLELSKGLGSVGLSFGMAAVESVKLGVKMGILSRGSGKDTQNLFMNLGDQATQLNVNMENLAEPMMQLAEATGRAGGSASDSALAFNRIAGAAKGLKNLEGPFNKMFSTMKDADKVGAIKSFTSSFTKIGDMQWAAFSAKKGEKFWDTVGRVSSATATDKVGYLGDLSRKLNINKMKNPIQQEFTMGMVASQGAFGNDWKGARQFGRMALDLQNKGGTSEKAVQDLLASQLDQRFQNKQTLGQWQAGGGDTLAYMAHQLELILHEIQTFFSRVPGWMLGAGAKETTAAGAGGKGSYAAGAAGAGRSRSPVQNAAGVSRP